MKATFLAALSLCPTVALPAQGQVALAGRIEARLAAAESDLIALRRDLHRHPEVSGAEERTAGQVAARLRALGLEVRTGVGGHGVVGILAGGRPGPVVAFRADMDAVPSSEPDPVEFRSVVPGIRHICGHDVHTAIGVALATGFAAVRADLAGTIVFVFQPAEERATGAEAMLADGLFGNPTPVAIYGVHTAPFPVGQLGTTIGDLMSGRDRFRIAVRGTGDLAAAVDTVRGRLTGIGTVPLSEILRPAPPDVILVQPGRVRDEGGERILEGMIMATSRSRDRARRGVEALAGLTLTGVTIEPRYVPKAIAGVTNDSALTVRAIAAVRGGLGPDAVVDVPTVIPAFSEDFGSFQSRVPGVFFFLGVSNPATGTVGMPHSPQYVADEGAILVGARAMTRVMLDRLGGS